MNQQEYQEFKKYKRKKALYTLAVLGVFGVWWCGTQLFAYFESAAIGKAITKAKIERITKIINQPDKYSYLRFATKKETIILQAASSSKDSVAFVMGKPIKTSLHIYEHMEKVDFYNATSKPYKRIKIAKDDIKEALGMEDKIKNPAERFMMIETINPKEPVTLINGILFNGVDLKNNGYRYAHKGKPASFTLTNKGLPITVESMKSIEGELMSTRKFPVVMDKYGIIGINIKPPKEGNDQTWAFDMYVTTELGTKHQYRVERKNKETLIYEVAK